MKIENCLVKYRCPKTWEALVTTANPGIRYCSTCDRGVHLCQSVQQLKIASDNGWCVAVEIKDSPQSPRSPVEVAPGFTMLVGDIALPYDTEIDLVVTLPIEDQEDSAK